MEGTCTRTIPTAAAAEAGRLAARLDRLPVTWRHWQLVLLGQFFWASVLLLDPLPSRVYPVVWEPQHAFGAVQYSVLIGVSNGFGPLVGGYLFGFIADRYGRKPVMVASCLVTGLMMWPLGFTSSWPVLLACILVASLGVGGALAVVPAYNAEWSPPSARSRLMLGAQLLSQAMIGFLMSGVALLLLPRHVPLFVVLFSALPLAVVPLIVFFLPESPRWLEGKGRFGQADRIVSRLERTAIAKAGRLPEPDPTPYAVPVSEPVPFRELFRGPYLSRTVVLLVVWVTFYWGPGGGFTPFQGVYIVSKGYTASQLFTLLFFAGFGSIAAILVGTILSERVERRHFIFVSALLLTIAAALYFVASGSFAVLMAASILASAGFAGMLSNLYNYTAAAYPTRLRSVGVGVTDGVGHLSAVIGPVIVGVLYTATASANHVGWFAWFDILGVLLPAVILLRFGLNQRRAALEHVSR